MRDGDDQIAVLHGELAALAARVAVLEARSSPPQRRNGPDTASPADRDATLLVAIAAAVERRLFSSPELIAHADADPALRRVLDALHITSARALGKVLRRLEDRPVGALALVREDVERHLVIWRISGV